MDVAVGQSRGEDQGADLAPKVGHVAEVLVEGGVSVEFPQGLQGEAGPQGAREWAELAVWPAMAAVSRSVAVSVGGNPQDRPEGFMVLWCFTPDGR